jgi:hypothetical protein
MNFKLLERVPELCTRSKDRTARCIRHHEHVEDYYFHWDDKDSFNTEFVEELQNLKNVTIDLRRNP